MSVQFHPRAIGLRDLDLELYFDDYHNDAHAQEMAMSFLLARGCEQLYCVWPPAHALDGSMRYRMVGRIPQ